MANDPANGGPALERPAFGEREAGFEYPPRPGAYAVARDSAGRIAVFLTPRGGYLPGGGLEPGESAVAGLHREVLEECGGEVEVLARLGDAVEYVHTAGRENGIAKECVYFLVRFLADPPADGGEEDHELVWLSPSEAEEKLAHGSARWAVRRALEHPVNTGDTA